MFGRLFNKSIIDILEDIIEEIYSLLSVALPSQNVIVEISDRQRKDKLVVVLRGDLCSKVENPMSELKELHKILIMNIKLGRDISVSID